MKKLVKYLVKLIFRIVFILMLVISPILVVLVAVYTLLEYILLGNHRNSDDMITDNAAIIFAFCELINDKLDENI